MSTIQQPLTTRTITMKIYKAFNIDWDTEDFAEEDIIAMGTDEPLWDLPSEVSDIELDDENDPEEEIAEYLTKQYGFCINGCEFAEVEVND